MTSSFTFDVPDNPSVAAPVDAPAFWRRFAADLPEDIRPLARRHAVSIRDETWDTDVDRLVTVIEGVEAKLTEPDAKRFASAKPLGSIKLEERAQMLQRAAEMWK